MTNTKSKATRLGFAKTLLSASIAVAISPTLVAQEQAGTLWCLPNTRAEVPANSQRTHFEIKYLARKETCWQLTMVKPKGYQTRFDTWQVS